jgi:hypothetical protein
MDIETAAAVERLSDRIDRLALSFRGEMGELRGELRGEVGGLRGELREGLAENRRHTQVLFESLRDDIRILADGFAHISAKIDSQER